MRCTVCGNQICGLDYPHEGMLCDSCRDDIAYEKYCELQQQIATGRRRE